MTLEISTSMKSKILEMLKNDISRNVDEIDQDEKFSEYLNEVNPEMIEPFCQQYSDYAEALAKTDPTSYSCQFADWVSEESENYCCLYENWYDKEDVLDYIEDFTDDFKTELDDFLPTELDL